jgi:hypothetical protein
MKVLLPAILLFGRQFWRPFGFILQAIIPLRMTKKTLWKKPSFAWVLASLSL